MYISVILMIDYVVHVFLSFELYSCLGKRRDWLRTQVRSSKPKFCHIYIVGIPWVKNKIGADKILGFLVLL